MLPFVHNDNVLAFSQPEPAYTQELLQNCNRLHIYFFPLPQSPTIPSSTIHCCAFSGHSPSLPVTNETQISGQLSHCGMQQIQLYSGIRRTLTSKVRSKDSVNKRTRYL